MNSIKREVSSSIDTNDAGSREQERVESPGAPDFRTCPGCGKQLEVVAEHRLYASNHIQDVSTDAHGSLTGAAWGISVPDWTRSRLLYFRCSECGRALPERFQTKLLDCLNRGDPS